MPKPICTDSTRFNSGFYPHRRRRVALSVEGRHLRHLQWTDQKMLAPKRNARSALTPEQSSTYLLREESERRTG